MLVVAVVLVAGALAGIGIARSGSGPATPGFTVVQPIPPVVAADAELAAGPGGTASLRTSLTGIAGAGETVVAIGTQPSQPGPLPLFLISNDGGHTWTRATVAGAGGGPGTGTGAPGSPGLVAGPAPGTAAGPAGGAGAGTAPVLVARGGSTWLALGQHAAWTSATGSTWRQAPALPPVAGDTVLGLASTGNGFVAVGEHAGTQPGPVVWTSSAGRPWQRRSGPELGLTARGGHATALRWAAAADGVLIAGGPVSGSRPGGAGVWRSTDGGLTWQPVALPVSHGATAGLAGLAAGGAGFVAARPGHAAGRGDAVVYLSAQGTTWRYAGRLTPVRRTSLQVTAVSGGSDGFVVAATVHSSPVAFFSARGLGWQQIAGPGTGLAGLTTGPGGTVVAAGNSQSGTAAAGLHAHLLLLGPGSGRQKVGHAALAAGATPDVTVNSLAASGRTLIAAGASGGAPALWLNSAGHWASANMLLPTAWRDGALASVVHGDRGWLAIGQAAAPALPSPQAGSGAAGSLPVILTSAAGTSWMPALTDGPVTDPGASLVQAAAGPAGYVVAGSAPPAGAPASATPAPVAWYSKDLSTWARTALPVPGAHAPVGAAGGNEVLAVTAGGPGFVAAGSAGATPVIWTSPTGSAWRPAMLPRPSGAAGAVLTKVTAARGRVVATGYAWRAGSPPGTGRPFSAVSADGGRTWQESAMPAPPQPTVVTALTAAGPGFVAVGHTGPPGRQHLLAWWSSDGLTWLDSARSGGGPGGSLVTQINAVTAGHGVLTGAGFAAGSAAEHPVLWHARYH